MTLNLEKMSRDELLALRADVDKALKSVETRRKAEARAAVEKAAKEFGFSIDDIYAKGAPKEKNPPKYRHPENPEKTWTGRGRKPGWVTEWLAAGKDIEDLAI
ncbi:DNA-binding protein H-NS [Poseidonocella pacifica]|uniref:DNA-binding protein H-NS n=1 Tax=Poseidonocella pacifica TaxID=871651 RepID=A0A1I0YWW3_9RHOB|nr:H-NS histone family protein [Poseidonocella pacifica]SFB17879.1 DNA-binding protein H-NS [Poseidonocella pacifica]